MASGIGWIGSGSNWVCWQGGLRMWGGEWVQWYLRVEHWEWRGWGRMVDGVWEGEREPDVFVTGWWWVEVEVPAGGQ